MPKGTTCPRCNKWFRGQSLGQHVLKCAVTAAELYWSKIDKEAPNGCWLWTRSVNNWGYGRVTPRLAGERAAHRVSWALRKGRIPAGMGVLHRCDTPRCVNPEHLFLGTAKDNSADAVAKDRHCRGERMRRNKLTDADVIEIRARYQRTMTGDRTITSNCKQMSDEFGVTTATIYHAALGHTWKHLK